MHVLLELHIKWPQCNNKLTFYLSITSPSAAYNQDAARWDTLQGLLGNRVHRHPPLCPLKNSPCLGNCATRKEACAHKGIRRLFVDIPVSAS